MKLNKHLIIYTKLTTKSYDGVALCRFAKRSFKENKHLVEITREPDPLPTIKRVSSLLRTTPSKLCRFIT